MSKPKEDKQSISYNAEDHFLNKFFYPETVAIVGSSQNPMKTNYQLMENNVRLKFKGRVFPVNPKIDEVMGIKAYPRLKDISEKIDLVVLAIPAKRCPDIIRECIMLGIERIVIVSGGFSEGGDEGERLHEEIRGLISEGNLRVTGPNTLSPVNSDNNLVISYHMVEKIKKGGVSFVFQSGLYEYKLNWLYSHMGINKALDLGNKLDVNELDALEYLGNDTSTKAIAMHIESIHGDGNRFKEILKQTTAKKPVVILKSGRTGAGSKAAASHTGSMAKENDAIFDALIRQSGGVRANNLEDFFDLAKTFAFLNPPKGNRAAVITLSGGEGVLATDACEIHGLQMAKLGQKSYDILKNIFPPWEMPLNPFDMGVCFQFQKDDLEKSFGILTAISEDDGVDCVIMQLPTTIVHIVANAMKLSGDALIPSMDLLVRVFMKIRDAGKPFAIWRSSMDEIENNFVSRIETQSIPVYQSSDRAARAMSVLYRYNEYRKRN